MTFIIRHLLKINSIGLVTRNSRSVSSKMFSYPQVKREDVRETFFGREVSDPYRALEDPDATDTVKFVAEQNALTEPFLKEGDVWSKINKKMQKLWNFEKFTCVSKHGKNYYYSHNSGLQNQNVIYVVQSLKQSEPKVFINPNQLSSDGTISLAFLVFSHDGSRCAYGLSESGSDWIKIKFKNVEINEDYPEALQYSKFFRPTFTHDNKGVFYGRFDSHEGKADGSETKANENQKVYYHRLGTKQDSDVLVAEFPDEPQWRFSAEVSACGNYLVFYVMVGCNDQLLYFSDLRQHPKLDGKLRFEKIVTKFESDYEYITNEGSLFYFRTNKDSPNHRVIVIDFENYQESNWKVLIEEHPKNVLDSAICVDNDKLVLSYMQDVKSVLSVHSLKTGEFLYKFKLGHGTVQSFSGEKDQSEFFYHYVSFLEPGTIFAYDFKTPSVEPEIFKEVKIESFDKNEYVVDQIFYPSTDTTQIPMFIVRKNAKEIRPKPLLLYGYGGFNIAIQPTFSITLLAFIDIFDGALAFPNIRGGGEYGKRWHDSGRLLNKQNVFDDFQEAAKYLIANSYTSKEKIAIQGGSNGGLLVGACINQKPNLFKAAVAQVGVFDMLRFHKFTIGSAWISDFGNPDEEVHFNNLMKYSPLHNTLTPSNPDEEYPGTLILTADHDDRVSPLHSLKFAATLQNSVRNSTYQKNPIFLRVDTKSGHGQGKPVAKKIEEASDILAFLYKVLKVEKEL